MLRNIGHWNVCKVKIRIRRLYDLLFSKWESDSSITGNPTSIREPLVITHGVMGVVIPVGLGIWVWVSTGCKIYTLYPYLCNPYVKTCGFHHTHDLPYGGLNFSMDGWTLLNHKAYIAVTIHFQIDGKGVSMLLDLIKVACSHTGVNLALAFAKVLDDFGIDHKVRLY